MDYNIFPPEEMIDANVALPLSKSVSNRQLIINALTPASEPVPELMQADCDDSRALATSLATLASKPTGAQINVGAAGTAFRFITAYCAAVEGIDAVIDGSQRLRQRPISPLVDALRELGADITYIDREGYAPLAIKGHRLVGGNITITPTISSQFISALMMVAPTMKAPLAIDFGGEEPVSRPYIRMTAAQMQRAGADVEIGPFDIKIGTAPYRPIPPYAERDWTAASYWYAIAAVSAGFVTLTDIDTDSLQGDARVADMFTRLGVITAPSDEIDNALQLTPDPEQFSRFETDLTDNPDLAQTLAVTASLLGIPFHLRGLSTLRVKETDRLEAMRAELDKMGVIVEIRNDSELVWNGERHPVFAMPEIDTYADHRMAMAFAPAAIFIPGIVIRDIDVVTKSYPRFWDDLRTAGFELRDNAEPATNDDEEEPA